MKIEAINKTINIFKYNNNQYNMISRPYFYGNINDKFCYENSPQKTNYEKQTDADDIILKNISTLKLTPPNYIKKHLDEDSNLQTIQYSEIDNIKGYKDCTLAITNSNIKNINDLYQLQVYPKSNIGNVRNTKDCIFSSLSNSTETGSNADIVKSFLSEICDNSKINHLISHCSYLQNGANIENLNTNKLIISQNNSLFGESSNKKPVILKNAIVTKENIFTNNYNLNKNNLILWNKLSPYFLNHNGFADIDFCNINNLTCELLNAKNANIEKVIATQCENLLNCNISLLETNSIKNIKQSKINKINSKNKIFEMNTDNLSKIKCFEFKCPTKGTLIIKNNNNFIPQVNIINGTAEYKLTNITLDNFTAQKKITVAENTNIKNLILEEPNATVTIIGNSLIKNINFKNGGKVIIKNSFDGIHTDSNKINVKNGEIIKDYPLKGFDNIMGMKELKQQLYKNIILPLQHPELSKKYGINPINGVLLYGPPGCGKTFIAKKLAEETNMHFIEIKPSNVGDKYQHLTARNIASKFDEAEKKAPALIFIDEAEAIVPSREKLNGDNIEANEQVAELLQQLNNCKERNILVILASNEPQKIDSAIKRTGRIDSKIFIGQPDKETRKLIYKQELDKIYTDKTIDYNLLAQMSEYYTAEDIKNIVREAAYKALEKNSPIAQSDLIQSIKEVKPSLSEQIIKKYYIKGDNLNEN